MDFFQAQAHAHQRTKRLVALFALSVAATIAVMYIAIILLIGQIHSSSAGRRYQNFEVYNRLNAHLPNGWWDPQLFGIVAGGTIVVVASAALFKTAQLRQGGPAIAEMVGGRRIEPHTTAINERRLVNIVEEMSIASGISVPAVYVLDDEAGLNAFAAGLTTSDAVVAVTRGTLEKLNRDELQGVVAHEFSHILNGDMRMNIRLVAVLFGIFFLTIIGRGLVRSIRFTGGGRNKREGNILYVIAAIGLVLIIIGYIGYFFGRLIQAAVSRQREFLADASAVQFTRNPDGITNALKKIGGYALGGHVSSEKAAAIGHFFFAEGGLSNFFGLLATHPPLDTRIRAIDPQFNGTYFTPPETVDVEHDSFVSAGLVRPPLQAARAKMPLASSIPLGAIASIGTLTPDQVANAQTLINEIPVILRQAARTTKDATTLIYGLLLDTRPEVYQRQLAQLPAATIEQLTAFAEPLAALKPAHKLPLCQLALPALRDIPDTEIADFFATIKTLINADGQVSTFEFALQKILYRQLVLSHSPKQSPGSQIYSFQAVREEIVIILSAIAHASTAELAEAEKAFAQGTQQLRMLEGSLELLATNSCGSVHLDPAIDRLTLAAGPIKQRLLLACAHVANADGEIRVAEAELLRAFAAMLDCPMPPLTMAG